MQKAIGVLVLLGAASAGCGSPTDPPPGGPEPRTIFLNRTGGTYTEGADDSSANRSVIIDGTATIDPAGIGAAEWTAFVGCVRAKFAAFDVTVVDVDPGLAEHTELVVIDSPEDIGLALGVGTVSPLGCEATGPKLFRRGVTFLAWSTFGDAAGRCVAGAQTLANSFGLDEASSCPDVMSSMTNCGPIGAKAFTDADVRCGFFEERDCNCGGATQNSFAYLMARFGPAQ